MHRSSCAALAALLTLGAAALAGCNDPVSDEARARGEAQRAALDACFQAAGFTTGETSPAPADGGNRRGPGGNAWSDGSLRAADGTWLDLYSWSEWVDDPSQAPAIAVNQAEIFNQAGYDGYGEARAVGRRAYVPVGAETFASEALDQCLRMP